MIRLLTVLLVGLALPATAEAQVPNCVAPPGTAAIDEYCEVVTPPSHGRPQAPVRIAPSTARRLLASARGQAVLRSLGAYKRKARVGSTHAADSPVQDPAPTTGGGLGSALVQAPTVGGGLFVVLFAITIAVLGWYAAGRRRRDA